MIELDMRALDRQLRRLDKNLDRASKRGEAALTQALVEYGEDTLAEARQRAPHKHGALRGAGVVDGPHTTKDGKEVIVGFNIEYAAIQDVGGDVVPKRAKALFVPLRDGVVPGDPDLEFGVDFVLSQKVHIPGNAYLTGILQDRKAKMARALGRRMFDLMRRGRAR
ncbi:MAG: HK97 gp10 family phage protein [Candidatus Thermoplasmatota archaeon]|nr:HK97 gp10 family phage protein [Candidatus Thermoplasmatota archaeon]